MIDYRTFLLAKVDTGIANSVASCEVLSGDLSAYGFERYPRLNYNSSQI